MATSDGIPPSVKKVIVGIVLVLVSASLYQAQHDEIIDIGLTTELTNTVGYYYDVVRVTDGDTIVIDLNGTDERIRLIGINTPETVDPRAPVECFGKEAAKRMKDLAEGKIVRLEYDESQGMRDAYERLLAYVYLEDGQMLNRKMIADGYAYEYTYLKPYKYQSEFRQLQNIARQSGRGLWAPETCNGRN